MLGGSYVGELSVGPTKLRLSLLLEGPGKSTLFSIDQGNAPIPASENTLQGDRLTLKFAAIGAVYEARIVSPDRLEGTFTQGGQSFPLVFVRGEAPPARPAAAQLGPLTQQILDEQRQKLGTPGMVAGWAVRPPRSQFWSAEPAVPHRPPPHSLPTNGTWVRSANR